MQRCFENGKKMSSGERFKELDLSVYEEED